MKKIYILILLFCKLFDNALQAQSPSEFTTLFHFLEGTWQIKTDGGNMVEQWKLVDASTYKAVVNFMQDPKDNINADPLELITLKLENDTIYFISEVKDQNNDQPVKFIYSGIVDEWHIFVNPHHDFPQIISYKPVNKKVLHAKIEGLVEGENKVIEFNYTKSKGN